MVNFCLIKRKELQPYTDATMFYKFFLIRKYGKTFKGISNKLVE